MRALEECAPEALGVTRLTAQLACRSSFDLLPEDVLELARQCILDTIGVMIAGSDEPVVRAVFAVAREQGGHPKASVIGRSVRVPLRVAALVNGTAAHALDYDDCNLAMSGHASAVSLPPVLALAEHHQLPGRELINAFVLGIETACRVGATMAPGHYDRGFHATGTIGAVASAAASARTLEFDEDQTANSLSIATTMASGLKGLFGTMCKPLHAGRAAENGLYAALLTQSGLMARDDSIECRQGFADTLAPEFHPEKLVQSPKHGMYIRHNLFKYHAACYGAHGAIECGRLMRDCTPDLSKIESLTLTVAVENDKTCNIPVPTDATEARFSLRHCLAMALVDVDTGSVDAFGALSLANETVAALRERVEVVLEPGLDIAESRLEARMADGRTHQVSYNASVPESDLVRQRQRLLDKFDMLVTPVLGRGRSLELREAILAIDRLNNVAELTPLMASAQK